MIPFMNIPGTLYIVSTPIGNLEDITLRALRILKEVDLIAAEDTRHTRKLLSAYDIHTPLTSYFDQNETQKSGYLLQNLLDGKSIALVSDAGTPGISDPGYAVIVAAIAQQIQVVPIPGPSAIITALTVSGLALDSFVFIGFLTNKHSARIKQLKAIQSEQKTLVCYASPHHIRQTLIDIHKILGNRRIAAARELTKKFEEIVRGTVETVIEHFSENIEAKGEFTLVIEGSETPEKKEIDPEMILRELQKCITEQNLSKKDAVKYVVDTFGLPKNPVYQQSLKL
ncbi:ribosomal RNA small subunit methyltransferase I [Candidatus Vecturithrix granuli]|uniref:Ribosomal RNA small subunit methyltransferase I n=1 Tax=Vecturithrix granuli TaxID=1499967 RepID=A0A081C3M0_VECG1|nr:ribosomal RNA small subunit methyltransferase I [Candidatus Vecturithrix granuli]